MRVCNVFIMLFTSLMIVSSGIAQDEERSKSLLVNHVLDNAFVCTYEQATSFYETLHGFKERLDEIGLVGDRADLDAWLGEYLQWVVDNWAPFTFEGCQGISFLLDKLHMTAYLTLIQQKTSELGEMFDDDTLNDVETIALVDLANIERKRPIDVLRINEPIMTWEQCTGDQAIAFYQTLDGFVNQTDDLKLVDEWEALKTWMIRFRRWRDVAWEAIYEAPCGGLLPIARGLELTAYLAGLTQVLEGRTGDALERTIQAMRVAAEADLAVIEAMTGE